MERRPLLTNQVYSVSLSADGQTVAIGAPYNNGNGELFWSCSHLFVEQALHGASSELTLDGEAG